MPKFAVYYSLTQEYQLIIDAESLEEARANWSDSAYWDSEPEFIDEVMGNYIDIEEID